MPELILESIFRHAELSPNKIAITENESFLTYKELSNEIVSRATIFSCRGVNPSNKMILIAEMTIDFVLNYFACHYLGAIAVPIDKSSSKNNISYFKKILNTDFIQKGKPDSVELKKNFKPKIMIKEEIIADILFTTGTTLKPKGVTLTQLNIATAANHTNLFLKNSSEDIELISMPFSHSFGLTRLRCSMKAGSSCVLIDGLSKPKKFFEALERKNITGFGIVPAGWEYLRKISKDKIKNYKDQIKYVELGSSPMSVDSKLDVISNLPNTHVCMHYGSTEASRSCFLDFKKDIKYIDSVGKASNLVNVTVLDNKGNIVNTNQHGEIAVEGRMVSPGYINFKKKSHTNFPSYHRMGDIGYINDEGFLYLLGRSSDIINIGGKKVVPEEVENCLKDIDEIIDCACVGIDDNISGESLKAFLVVKKNHKLNYPSVKKILLEKLEPYKIPTSFELVDKIPYSKSGKIKRSFLKN